MMNKEIKELEEKKVRTFLDNKHKSGIALVGEELEKCYDWLKFFDNLTKKERV